MILAPHISEKAVAGADRGVYVFDVPMSANKAEIARAVEENFKVKVANVNVMIKKGKLKRFRQIAGRQSNQKLAMVRLTKGQTIKALAGGK